MKTLSPLLSIVLFSIIMADCGGAFAQQADTLKHKNDSATLTNRNESTVPDSTKMVKQKGHSAKKALLYSALLPGLGQGYNHKYWKIPIIYAGIGVMSYFVAINNQQYVGIEQALKIRTNGGIDQYQQYTTTQLTTIRDQYHYNRDLSVVGILFVYVLNLVDAEVDAQFFNFNMSDDISAHFTPTLNPVASVNGFVVAPSLAFVLRLK